MNRQRQRLAVALAALVLLAGCAGLTPRLDYSKPINTIYTTRLAVAQTYDVLTAMVQTGQLDRAAAQEADTRLAQVTLTLELAEGAADVAAQEGYLAAARRTLNDVRAVLGLPATT